jgi:Flp pilus assembly protein TadG
MSECNLKISVPFLEHSHGRRGSAKRGSEILEFALVLPLMLGMFFVLFDSGWAIFAKSTLQRAVRIGVKAGVNTSASGLAQGQCLTQFVKSTVQQNALGLLYGSFGLNSIKVNYLQPPPPPSTAQSTDVSTQSTGDTPGNIMQVSVQNFSLVPLLPRIFGGGKVDDAPMSITVYAADMIEPNGGNTPCIGTAP